MAEKQEKYWSKKGPDGDWDYIVIGSGMGGMTSAALLATLGKKVLVLEQHFVPGGFTHMFRRKNWIWDVGVHAVGEVTRHSMSGRLLDKITGGHLKWSSLGSVYEQFYFPDDFRLDFPDNPKQFKDNLMAAFPDEEPAIDRYIQYAADVSAGMKGYYFARTLPPWLARPFDWVLARKAQNYLEMNTAEVVNGLTDNEQLRAVMTAQWAYYGSTPSRSSFAMQALVNKHYKHGAYYPVGGAREIARCLLRTVAEAGGWTRINADVAEILMKGNRAVGVRMKDGEEIFAGKVISATGIAATIRRLLPERFHQQEWAKSIMALKPAPAHVCLYLGFKGDIRKTGASGANKWFYNTWDAEVDYWDISDPDSPAPVLYCSFPSLKDPDHDPGPEVLHTGEVVTFVPFSAFQKWRDTAWKKRGEEYEAFKKQLHDSLLRQFLERMPDLEPMIAYSELSTPLTTDNFCRPQSGSIYGLEPTPERFRNPHLGPHSPIKNLYFSGSEVCSVGVIGAMMGGVLGAMAAEPLPAFRLMGRL